MVEDFLIIFSFSRYEGYLSKRRKWPLKGWHKRFFVMEQGALTYAKTKTDITRGRTLGKNEITMIIYIYIFIFFAFMFSHCIKSCSLPSIRHEIKVDIKYQEKVNRQ